MAIFHLNAKVISRSKGQSAIAAAAYRSGNKLRDEQSNEPKSYKARADRIMFTAIMAPKDAPEWARDRNALWNQAERAEKRKDAQLAREIEVSLPHELTAQQREWLVKDFAREAFVRRGYAVDIVIHAPDKRSDARNHHAHLLVTMRTVGPDGFAVKKDRSLNSTEQLSTWREQWAQLANRHLERHGHEARVDHRSLEARGIEREATVHVGYAGMEIDARGGQSDRMEILKEIIERNEIRVDLAATRRALDRLGGPGERQAAEPRPRAKAAPDAARTAPIAEQGQGGPAPIRLIGGIVPRAARGARPVGGLVKTAGRIAEGVVSALEGFLGGGSSRAAPAADKRPLDAGPVPPQAETDKAQQLAESDRSARRQKYLREFSREVPEERQQDADLERDRKGRERTRGE